MDTRLRRFTALLLLLCAACLLAAGCGGSDDEGSDDSGSSGSTATKAEESGGGGGGDTDAKELFASACGGCHTLDAAGTSGSVGPNLNDVKLDAEAVRAQIKNGGGAMPPGLLEGEQADAVAAYVAANDGS